eukprot:g4580.t1
MMQRQAINWIRSTAVDVAPMRYPGEYTFPGGGRDEGETIRETALRELTEELGIDVPDSTLHLFNVRQTRPVRGVSYIMYNFVMLESQNEWIKALNIERINASLREKEEAFEKMRESGEFFNLSAEQRHHFSPEMHDVQWLHLCDAAVNAFTSMNPNLTFVNRWQEEKFLRYNFQRRDPMFVTLQTIVQMDAFHSPSALLDFCKSLGSAEDELGKIQYLYDGMAEEAVFQTFQGKRVSLSFSPSKKAGKLALKRKEQFKPETPGNISDSTVSEVSDFERDEDADNNVSTVYDVGNDAIPETIVETEEEVDEDGPETDWIEESDKKLESRLDKLCNNCNTRNCVWYCHGCNYQFCHGCHSTIHKTFVLQHNFRTEHFIERVDGKNIHCSHCRKSVWDLHQTGFASWQEKYQKKFDKALAQALRKGEKKATSRCNADWASREAQLKRTIRQNVKEQELKDALGEMNERVERDLKIEYKRLLKPFKFNAKQMVPSERFNEHVLKRLKLEREARMAAQALKVTNAEKPKKSKFCSIQ